jgi:hypothetical protein
VIVAGTEVALDAFAPITTTGNIAAIAETPYERLRRDVPPVDHEPVHERKIATEVELVNVAGTQS